MDASAVLDGAETDERSLGYVEEGVNALEAVVG